MKEMEKPPQVAKRDHGNTIAHQRVVGIVPLGALRIHPSPAFGNKVGDLSQGHDQHLFNEIDVYNGSIGRTDQGAIGP